MSSINVTLSREQLKQVDELGEASSRTRAQVVSDALEALLKSAPKQKKKAKAKTADSAKSGGKE